MLSFNKPLFQSYPSLAWQKAPGLGGEHILPILFSHLPFHNCLSVTVQKESCSFICSKWSSKLQKLLGIKKQTVSVIVSIQPPLMKPPEIYYQASWICLVAVFLPFRMEEGNKKRKFWFAL